jgi:hypothetical protein
MINPVIIIQVSSEYYLNISIIVKKMLTYLNEFAIFIKSLHGDVIKLLFEN